MAGTIQLDPNPTLYTCLDDSLGAGGNSLSALVAGSAVISGTRAFNSASAPSSIDNTTRLDDWMDLELTIFMGSVPTTFDWEAYIVPTYDGTNYADGTTGASPVFKEGHRCGAFRATQSGKNVLTLRRIPIPPTKFQIQLVNGAGASSSSAGTGSRLRALTYREKYT